MSNDEITSPVFGKCPPPWAVVGCGGSAAHLRIRNRPLPDFRPMPPAQHAYNYLSLSCVRSRDRITIPLLSPPYLQATCPLSCSNHVVHPIRSMTATAVPVPGSPVSGAINSSASPISSRRFLPSLSSISNHHPPQLIPALLQHQPRLTVPSPASLTFRHSPKAHGATYNTTHTSAPRSSPVLILSYHDTLYDASSNPRTPAPPSFSQSSGAPIRVGLGYRA